MSRAPYCRPNARTYRKILGCWYFECKDILKHRQPANITARRNAAANLVGLGDEVKCRLAVFNGADQTCDCAIEFFATQGILTLVLSRLRSIICDEHGRLKSPCEVERRQTLVPDSDEVGGEEAQTMRTRHRHLDQDWQRNVLSAQALAATVDRALTLFIADRVWSPTGAKQRSQLTLSLPYVAHENRSHTMQDE